MNRLKGMRAYLCGCIDRVADRGIIWRDDIEIILNDFGVISLNPLKKTTNIGAENEQTAEIKKKLKKDKKYDELAELMKVIRNVDLRMVDVCDFLIANIDLELHPTGTYEEIFLANRQKKPILIRIEQGKENIPDWLFGAIPHQMFFSNWKELINYLQYINLSEKIETYNRWQFLTNFNT